MNVNLIFLFRKISRDFFVGAITTFRIATVTSLQQKIASKNYLIILNDVINPF